MCALILQYFNMEYLPYKLILGKVGKGSGYDVMKNVNDMETLEYIFKNSFYPIPKY